ncbi:E3 SUMO-protein ligase RanBP2-like [Amphibalanus amphitrite]|uniref:E3 SUMO-protein ligase RanBP2-like n=1 Tax=Amphibalanus amphitrite TaxID=1232801 RepID=UPI001C8FE995|nr:E3 SUMO-protein ligase RanBP2-like [Amphibalanus amphitrite]
MTLYTKKKDVERYVKELLSKVKTDDERKLKGFTIARMFHQVGDQRTARQYLSWYLEARPGAAPAHKLLGQVLAASGEPAAALSEFGFSLELDPHQKDLVMTGCKLLLELPASTPNANRWLEHATKYFKSDPIVLKLRQHLRDAGGGQGVSGEDVDKLLAAELAAEPTDPERHVRLAERLAVSAGPAEAARYVRRVEERRPFPRSAVWYQCVAAICQKYQSSVSSPDRQYQLLRLEALDRVVALALEERRPISEITTDLYRLDQQLLQVSRELESAGEPEQARLESAALLNHITGQLFFHMGSVLLLGAAQGVGEAGGDGSREASDMALALFLAAQAYQPLDTVSKLYQCSSRQAVLDVWRRQAGARQVEVGWSVLAAETNSRPDHVLRVQQQFCTQKGRSRIHSRLFRSASVSGLGRADTSAFLTLPAFLETNPVAPRPADLLPLAPLFWQEHAGRLQQTVWLRLRAPSAGYQPPGSTLPLQARGAAPNATAAPETLCLLDVLCFLEATVYVTSQLRVAEQAEWWAAVHRLQGEPAGAAPVQELAALRRQLQRGLEAVRCLPGHGNSVRLVMHLAHWALQQAVSGSLDQAAAYESRAELYLRAALPLLERLQRGGADRPPKQRLFDCSEPEPEPDGAALLRDEACRLLSGVLQRRGLLQEALPLVADLPSADAAYQQGLILHQLALRPEVEDSSELLRRSLESFYLTLDRLRDPVGSGSALPSREDLASQIREVEHLIAEQTAASTHVNGSCSADVTLDRSVTASRWLGLAAGGSVTSTPRRPATSGAVNNSGAAASPLNLSASFGQEARPSMERMCAELQGLKVAVRSLTDQQRQQSPPTPAAGPDTWPQRSRELRDAVLADVRGALAEELPQLRRELQELRLEVAEMRKQKQQEAQAPPPQPQQPAMPPELFGFMAALTSMQRGMPPMMPMGLAPPPPAMAYPAAAYQGMSLQDTSLTDPLASSAALGAQLPAQAGLVGPPQPPAPAAAVPPAFSFRPTDGPAASPAPSAPPVEPDTPSFSFRPPTAEGATSTPAKPSAPANVTVSSREPLPAAVSAAPTAPPSVIVPPEHIKPQVMTPQRPTMGLAAAAAAAAATAEKSPHQFQIRLPSSAQLNVTSPLGDSDKPAYTTVSTLPNIPAPQFSAVSPLQNQGRSPGRDRLDSTGSFHEDPDYEPMADFKPVVALPEEVEVRTGEEGDTPLFAARCKLFRFTEGEWKERGIGELRVLHREDDGRVRVVMRRDQTHKVCANHFLQPGMELNSMKNQPRAVIWAAKDFADEELKDERLCARFKTEEEVEKFRGAFRKGLELIKAATGKSTASKSPVKTPAAATPAKTPSGPAKTPSAAPSLPAAIPSVVSAGADDNAEEDDDDDDWYETEDEETTSDEEEDEEPLRIACKPEFNFAGGTKSNSAFSFGFGGGAPAATTAPAAPSTGFRFGDKAPATTASTTFGFGFGKTTPATGASSSTDGGFKFGQAPSAATPSTTAGASAAAATGFKFGLSTATPSTPSTAASSAATPATTTGFRFGQGLTSVSFTTPTASTPAAKTSLGGFSFTTTPNIKKSEPAPAAATTTQSEAKPSPFAGFSFGSIGQGSTGALSFAAAADSGPGFKKDDSFKGFAGSGAPVFGGSPAKGADGEDADTTAEEYEPSVHFEPVVPLPELVDTKTGEESEEKLFGHRAKLYRMDTATKEWKERGIGEIKILKNADTGKCRVLMRREQVLKLCANHVIRPEMSLAPLQSSQSAWVWSANDFSEGEASQETLAVKFKTPELAQQFKEVFESCQKATAATPAKPSAPKAAESASSGPAPSAPPAAAFGSTGAGAAATPTNGAAAGTPSRSSFVFGSGTGPATGGQFHFSGVKPKSPVKPSRSRDASLNESAGGDDNEYYEGDEGEHLLFEPVIPLPDKVEVKTGEEEEEVLYSHRAKLYRFAKETGEWKERGLGDIKLLEHRQTHKIRLLMRREQVLKICMNHRVTPQLEMKLKDDRSVVWAATDYAEPEPHDEMFVARFKTAEVAAEFVAAVQKAQGRTVASPAKSAPAPAAAPSAPSPATPQATPATIKPSAPAAQSPSIFGGGAGASPGSGFSFGNRFGGTPAAQSTATDGPSTSFTFRLPATASSTAAAADSDSDEVTVVGEVQPTEEQRAAAARLQLPAGFYLYEQRPPCRGCRGCWDQMPGEARGEYTTDEGPVSSTPGSGAAASSTTTPSVAASAPAAGAGAATPNSSFNFKAASFAFGGDQSKVGEATPKATFGFGASSAASSPFKFSLGGDANKSGSSIFGGAAAADTKTTSIFGGSSENKTTSIFGGASTSDNKTTSIFGGASSETKPASIFGGTPSSETKTTSIFGTPSVFGGKGTDKPVPLFGGAATGDKSKENPIFGGSGTDSKSSSLFGGSTSGGQPAPFGSGSSVFGSSGWPSFGSAAAKPASSESDAAAKPATTAADPQPSSTFGLGLQSSGPIVDFAAMAAKAGQPVGAKADPSFQFSGAGAAVFGGGAAAKGGADGGGSDGEEGAGADDSAHDPHFEPIVPLPELVDVKTGEEDEKQLFCHRAILYRFNKDTSEWKERGRGDFKLLHNSSSGSYRVLLRREQVHKLACNHRVLPDMVLTRLGSSDRAWVWSAMDYADEEPKAETFAVKFKTEALANEFKAAFEAAVQKLAEAPAAEEAPGGAEEPEGAEEGEGEDEDGEYEDDDSPMFERHATLHVNTGDVWKRLGSGELQVVYDEDVYCVRVMMINEDTENPLCDVLITMQHNYLLEGSTVSWTALDYALDPPMRRTLRASLDSEEAAEELARVMNEGVEIAAGSGIGDTEEATGAAGSGAPADGLASLVGDQPPQQLLGACDPALARALAELLAESASAPPPPPPADEE